jgi:FAD/FMN-containing dehydrogenase
MYPMSRAPEALTVFAEYAREAPDELDLGWSMMLPPDGAPGMVGFSVCYSGPAAGVERALAPLRKVGTPLSDDIKAMDYVALQRSGDVTDPRAMAVYLKSGFVPSIPPDLVTAIVDRFQGHPARGTQIFFQSGGGAIARVAPDATAFSQRDIHSNMLCSVFWPLGGESAEHIQWIRQYWAGLERFTHGFYVNDLAIDATASAVQANYRANHARLVAVKTKYDPKNLFRLNANVKPAAV